MAQTNSKLSVETMSRREWEIDERQTVWQGEELEEEEGEDKLK